MAKKPIKLTQGQLLLVATVLVVGGYFLYTTYFQAWGTTYEIYNRGDAPIECWMEQYLDGDAFTIPAGSKREWTPEQGWGSTDLGECYCPGWEVMTNAVDVGFYTQNFLGSPNYVDIDCGGGSTTTTTQTGSCSDSTLRNICDTNNDCYITNPEVSILLSRVSEPWLFPQYTEATYNACYSKLMSRQNAGYNTYPGCSAQTCDDSDLADYDSDGDCVIDGSELNSADGDVCYNRLYELYTSNDDYPECTPKTCQAYGYYVTQPSGKTCSYGYKNPPGLNCYYNCVATTTTIHGGTTTTTLGGGGGGDDGLLIGVVLGFVLLGVGYFIFKKK